MSEAGGTARLGIRVSPRASREALSGVIREADGATLLKIAVRAPAEDGKANAAAIALLADRLGLPRSAFEVAVGAASRRKVLRVAADAGDLRRRLASCLERP